MSVRTGGLTDRQWEILLAIAAGRTEMDICREMYLTRSTVSYHVGIIKRRLGGARTTAQIIHQAWISGLLTPESVIDYPPVVKP